MRRLKQTRVQSFFVKPRSVEKDREGVPVVTFGSPSEVKGEIWPATSKRQIEQYGDRISGISNMILQGYYIMVHENGNPIVRMQDGTTIRIGDGICVYTEMDEQPDYEVLSLTPYTPLRLEVQRIHG